MKWENNATNTVHKNLGSSYKERVGRVVNLLKVHIGNRPNGYPRKLPMMDRIIIHLMDMGTNNYPQNLMGWVWVP